MNPFSALNDAHSKCAFLPQSLQGYSSSITPWSEIQTAEEKASAVALLFLLPRTESGRVARIVLTRRSSRVRTHKGQIGFAGGRREPGDATPADTMLREVHEEIGIQPSDILVHGMLAPRVSIDGSMVVPVFATSEIDETLMQPAADEVAAIHLCDWVNFKRSAGTRFGFTIFGIRRESWLFNHSPLKKLNDSSDQNPLVWGLTAEILAQADMR